MQITKQQIEKLDSILARGLCKGMGINPNGQVCVEQAVCIALDLPFSDNPECVASSVRSFKIRLNDANWSSPENRAKYMRDLAIAQIGSKDSINNQEFAELITKKTIQILIPQYFRSRDFKINNLEEILKECESENYKNGIKKLRSAADYTVYATYAAAATYAADAAYAAATYTADAAATANAAYTAAAYTADAAYAAANAAYAAANAAAADKWLILSAQLALETLKELGSTGCQYL